MQTTTEYENWRVTTDDEGFQWLTLDKANSSTNTLGRSVLGELEHLLDAAGQDSPRGLGIQSAKDSGFIAGADIKEFQDLESAEQGASAAARGQAILQKLADLPCPTVAVIDGYALGGGLELALACDYRVAAEGYERSLGLPEVQLGIHPGFGGTIRAVQLLGAPLALDLMLSGRMLSPSEALKAGLVDTLAGANALESAARKLLIEHPPRRRAPIYLQVLSSALFRPWLARKIRAQIRR